MAANIITSRTMGAARVREASGNCCIASQPAQGMRPPYSGLHQPEPVDIKANEPAPGPTYSVMRTALAQFLLR